MEDDDDGSALSPFLRLRLASASSDVSDGSARFCLWDSGSLRLRLSVSLEVEGSSELEDGGGGCSVVVVVKFGMEDAIRPGDVGAVAMADGGSERGCEWVEELEKAVSPR